MRDGTDLREGDQLHVLSGGGGDTAPRSSATRPLVLDDVLGKKVSAKAARDEYRGVVDDTGRAVNIGATENVRQMLREVRVPVKWTFDRALELGRE